MDDLRSKITQELESLFERVDPTSGTVDVEFQSLPIELKKMLAEDFSPGDLISMRKVQEWSDTLPYRRVSLFDTEGVGLYAMGTLLEPGCSNVPVTLVSKEWN